MTYEIEVPDTPEQAWNLHMQQTFDDAAGALAKLEGDLDKIRSNMDMGVEPTYVMGIIRLAISLTELQLVSMDGHATLRKDQQERLKEVMSKHGRK